jgi:hypothetical protein
MDTQGLKLISDSIKELDECRFLSPDDTQRKIHELKNKFIHNLKIVGNHPTEYKSGQLYKHNNELYVLTIIYDNHKKEIGKTLVNLNNGLNWAGIKGFDNQEYTFVYCGTIDKLTIANITFK